MFRLIFYIFKSSFCANFCSVWLECVMFWLLLLSSSFQWECSCFAVFGASIIVLGYHCLDSLFVFWCIANISKSDNQLLLSSFVSKSLACCLKSSAFFSDFYNSLTIVFLCRVAYKITAKCNFVVFLSSFSMLAFLVCVFTSVVVLEAEKRPANLCRVLFGLDIRGTCRSWHPSWCLVSTVWLYQTQALFKICPCDRCERLLFWFGNS